MMACDEGDWSDQGQIKRLTAQVATLTAERTQLEHWRDGATAALDSQQGEISAITARCETRFSNERVVEFLGYLTGALPELHKVHPHRLLLAWNDFKWTCGDGQPVADPGCQS